MAKYSKGAQKKVKRAMHEKKAGTLKSGRSGKKVKSRKQAIAIGLSEAVKAVQKFQKRDLHPVAAGKNLLAENDPAEGRSAKSKIKAPV